MTKYTPFLFAAVAAAVSSCSTMAKIYEASTGPLQAMSDRLASADQISVSGIRRLDSQLIENKSVIGYAKVDMLVDRPDRVKVAVRGAANQRDYYLSKDGSVIYESASGHYARFPGNSTIEQALDAAAQEFGIHIPAQDFLSANPYKSLASNTDTITHAGVESIDGIACDRVKGSREDLSWNMWIAKSDKLPRRFTITIPGMSGSDQYRVDFHKWNLNPGLSANDFTFTPKKTDSEIEFYTPEEG